MSYLTYRIIQGPGDYLMLGPLWYMNFVNFRGISGCAGWHPAGAKKNIFNFLYIYIYQIIFELGIYIEKIIKDRVQDSKAIYLWSIQITISIYLIFFPYFIIL